MKRTTPDSTGQQNRTYMSERTINGQDNPPVKGVVLVRCPVPVIFGSLSGQPATASSRACETLQQPTKAKPKLSVASRTSGAIGFSICWQFGTIESSCFVSGRLPARFLIRRLGVRVPPGVMSYGDSPSPTLQEPSKRSSPSRPDASHRYWSVRPISQPNPETNPRTAKECE